MTHRERLETAWAFREPDRVPIELSIAEHARRHPCAERLNALIAEHADNFHGVAAYDWGFLGWPAQRSERVIERRPGQFTRRERIIDTPAGRFAAVVREPDYPGAPPDYHWERRFIRSPDDLRRLLEVAIPPRSHVSRAEFDRDVARIGETGIPTVGLLHPLGTLVRNATLEAVYGWFHTHGDLLHRLLEVANAHVVGAVEAMLSAGIGPTFVVFAHEMLIPPWLGPALFDEFVAPYDRAVFDAIHRGGGRVRAHCHGRIAAWVERFADLGIDAIEPLEGPPHGDVDLAEAKRRVGDRMLLSGNIASPWFAEWSPREVERAVRDAIRAAARGGGFTLRTTGGGAGTGTTTDPDLLARILANCEAYLLAGLEHGAYPIAE